MQNTHENCGHDLMNNMHSLTQFGLRKDILLQLGHGKWCNRDMNKVVEEHRGSLCLGAQKSLVKQ